MQESEIRREICSLINKTMRVLNNPSGGGKEAVELSLFKIVTVVSSMKC